MILPIVISVSLAPGSYFFCALAWVAIAATAKIVRAIKLRARTGIVLSRLTTYFFEVSQVALTLASARLFRGAKQLSSGKRPFRLVDAPARKRHRLLARFSRPRHDLDHLAFVSVRRICLGSLIRLYRRACHQRWAGEQALGEPHGISGVLVPKRCRERRAGEISRGHPLRMPDHLRARGNSALDRFHDELHVEAGLFGNRKALGDSRDLDRAHQIVDQLVDGTTADAAEMPDGGAKRREIRPRFLEIGGIGADQQRQGFHRCPPPPA